MLATISLRISIRWIPDNASEPSNTIVLTSGKNGIFLDVCFLKDSNKLDWAFAGYRSTVSVKDGELTKFTHCIDSRTKDPSEVADYGSNTPLSNGTILEKGEMINPETGEITAYEEVWREESAEPGEAIFLRNLSSTIWYARAGRWQLALGRDATDKFWAFQAKFLDQKWVVLRDVGIIDGATLLPEDTSDWTEGKEVKWNGGQWLILEKD